MALCKILNSSLERLAVRIEKGDKNINDAFLTFEVNRQLSCDWYLKTLDVAFFRIGFLPLNGYGADKDEAFVRKADDQLIFCKKFQIAEIWNEIKRFKIAYCAGDWRLQQECPKDYICFSSTGPCYVTTGFSLAGFVLGVTIETHTMGFLPEYRYLDKLLAEKLLQLASGLHSELQSELTECLVYDDLLEDHKVWFSYSKNKTVDIRDTDPVWAQVQ